MHTRFTQRGERERERDRGRREMERERPTAKAREKVPASEEEMLEAGGY
jgi:hypothetical protein